MKKQYLQFRSCLGFVRSADTGWDVDLCCWSGDGSIHLGKMGNRW